MKSHFQLFVHIDTKSEFTPEQLEELNQFENCVVISKFSITWGSFEHLLAVVDLLALAVAESRVKFIHIISGQDFPTISPESLRKKFDGDNGIYMSVSKIDQEAPPEELSRFEQFNLLHRFNHANRLVQILDSVSTRLQQLVGIKRSKLGKFRNVYKGMIWVSLSTEIAHYVLDIVSNSPQLMIDLSWSKIPEEFFFQTIICNSGFCNRVNEDNLRFTIWERRNGSLPAVLDEDDLVAIRNSQSVFARKVDSKLSGNLVKFLEGGFYRR